MLRSNLLCCNRKSCQRKLCENPSLCRDVLPSLFVSVFPSFTGTSGSTILSDFVTLMVQRREAFLLEWLTSFFPIDIHEVAVDRNV